MAPMACSGVELLVFWDGDELTWARSCVAARSTLSFAVGVQLLAVPPAREELPSDRPLEQHGQGGQRCNDG